MVRAAGAGVVERRVSIEEFCGKPAVKKAVKELEAHVRIPKLMLTLTNVGACAHIIRESPNIWGASSVFFFLILTNMVFASSSDTCVSVCLFIPLPPSDADG